MENEIKVGEFIRTKDGRIYQVDSSNDEWALSDIFYKVIVKHSSNLIDLIEVGDLIKIKTGQSSDVHIIEDKGDIIYLAEQMQAGLFILDKIYTKEMMESISYKVERKN